jgi:hypothetical protein
MIVFYYSDDLRRTDDEVVEYIFDKDYLESHPCHSFDIFDTYGCDGI